MQKQETKPSVKNLILDSLEIQGFRGFRHLTIERLGRVNLIVGKNNVGKTSLLEALWLCAQKGSPKLIWDILEARDEITRARPNDATDAEEQALAIKHLFYGRGDFRESGASIRIGPIQSKSKTLSITVNWYTSEIDEEGNQRWHLLKPGEPKAGDNPELRLATQIGERPRLSYPLDPNMLPNSWDSWSRRYDRPEFREITNIYRGPLGLDKIDLSRAWDNTTLTPLEESVIEALRIIAPNIQGINLIGDKQKPYDRIPIIKLENLDIRVPLRSMGDGVNRMFEIALALVNAKDGMLLIDEVENGIHYSVQADVWRLIFETAHRLNIQVFATTHSWDCIEAFTRAAVENEREEGLLIRLVDRKGSIVATLFNEQELKIATRNDIEVR